jgi:hypothetical protein
MNEKPSSLDILVSRYLARGGANASRRSFLSKLTRGVFLCAGVAVVAKVRPFAIPRANAALAQGGGLMRYCGMSGYVCGTGNCDCPSPLPPGTICRLATGPNSSWVACCQNTDTMCYHCCRYTDKCSTAPRPSPSGCEQHGSGGTLWCGGVPGGYVCTVTTCSATGKRTISECSSTCRV